jgi:hypothetical protein
MENILLLIKRNFIYEKKALLSMSIAITLIMFIIGFFNAWSNHGVARHEMSAAAKLFNLAYIVIILVSASAAFKEIYTPAKSHLYLMIPASNFEKLFATWISNSLILTTILLLCYGIGVLFGSSLAALSFGFELNMSVLNNPKIFSIIVSTLVAQTIYYCGGLFFKTSAFIKTTIYILLVPMALGILTSIFVFILTRGMGNAWEYNFTFDFYGNEVGEKFSFFFGEFSPQLLKTIFWVLAGPFFMTVSYFKLKESEV